MKQGAYQFWLTGITLYWMATACPSRAQIVPDATLPNNSRVTSQGNTTSIIEGGTQSGNHLFHSFEKFSVTKGTTAFFKNALDIRNIITRVTGGSISNIDGLIQAKGTANLFLLNPNGIIIGPNATLNIGGSFLASTASSVVFDDRSEFSATNPQAPPLLSINVPIGLQFGVNPGSIEVRGSGHNLSVAPRDLEEGAGAIVRVPSPGVTVKPGNTLAIVGGDVTLNGGNLTAENGRIELGSAASNSFVHLNLSSTSDASTFILNYDGVQNLGDIKLLNAASVDASGEGGGDIQVQTRQLIVRDGSAILALTEGANSGRNLTIRASEFIELSGIRENGQFFSGLLTETTKDATGNGGSIQIETGQLTVQGGGGISASTFGAGAAGHLTINANSVILTGESRPVKLIGESEEFPEYSFLSVLSTQAGIGAGAAGNLTINTKQFTVENGAQVTTATFGDFPGGNLIVNASEFAKLIGTTADDSFASALSTSTQGSEGSGNLRINTGQLIVQDGAQVSTLTLGAGNAGNLTVQATDIKLIGAGADGVSSGLFASVDSSEATGEGGNLSIDTERLTIQGGAEVFAGTYGAGRGGTLTVNARESVQLTGRTSNGEYPSALLVSTQKNATGDAGSLNITTKKLIVENGARVNAGTRENSAGRGGNLTVNASELVSVSGMGFDINNQPISSEILANSQGLGEAGDLEIITGQLNVVNGARVSVSGESSGAAGNLIVNAPNIRLNNRASLSATTAAGNFGNITLETRDIQLRRASSITTKATGTATGGNISINTDTLAALENSDIIADSVGSFGGRVEIDTQGIFRQGFLGIEVDRNSSPQRSDITATSRLGPQFDGIVDIETLNLDPSQGLFTLVPPNPPLLEQSFCDAIGKGSEFIVTGRGGLPPNPREALNLGAVMGNEVNIPESNRTDTKEFVEAQGWIRDTNGKIHLVASSPTVTPYSSGQNPPNCGNKN